MEAPYYVPVLVRSVASVICFIVCLFFLTQFLFVGLFVVNLTIYCSLVHTYLDIFEKRDFSFPVLIFCPNVNGVFRPQKRTRARGLMRSKDGECPFNHQIKNCAMCNMFFCYFQFSLKLFQSCFFLGPVPKENFRQTTFA